MNFTLEDLDAVIKNAELIAKDTPQLIICNPRYESQLRAACKPGPHWNFKPDFYGLRIEFDATEPSWRVETEVCPSCGHSRKWLCPNLWHLQFASQPLVTPE